MTASPIAAEPRPCKPWLGGLDRNGYGRNATHRRPAHVVAWTEEVGPIPPGMTVDHECHNLDGECPGGITDPHRACIEIEHLVARSIGDNARRAWRTRSTCGRGHPWTEANTYWRPGNGRRMCRRCAALRDNSAYRKTRDPKYNLKARDRMRRLRAGRRAA